MISQLSRGFMEQDVAEEGEGGASPNLRPERSEDSIGNESSEED